MNTRHAAVIVDTQRQAAGRSATVQEGVQRSLYPTTPMLACSDRTGLSLLRTKSLASKHTQKIKPRRPRSLSLNLGNLAVIFARGK